MIADNVKYIIDKITDKVFSLNRNLNDVTLIAVSKNFGPEHVQEAYNAGIRNFGENKAQELRDKYLNLSIKPVWHFIGHLQKNKIKYIIDKVEFIHSIDTNELAVSVASFAEKHNKKVNVLLEIKTSSEATKYGLSDIDEIYKTAQFCHDNSFLNLVGLMTIAPFVDDEKLIRNSFISLRELRDKLNKDGYNLRELSMGMTSDFEIALEEGATMIRIGTAIFGTRY